jgi:outer membrane protein
MKYFILLLLIPFTISAKQWTLDECVEYALKNSKTIRTQIQNLTADSARVSVAKSAFYPDLSASANTGLSGNPFANPDTDPTGTISMGLSSRVTLFDGRKNINRLESAKKTLEQDEITLEINKKAVITTVSQAYISLLYAGENLNNATEAAKLAENQFEYQKTLAEIGSATQLSITRSRAQAAKTDYSQILAQNSFNSALLQIKQLLDLPASEDFEIVYLETNFTDTSDLSSEKIFEQNKNNFAEIKSAQISVEIAEISLSLSKAGKSPTLSASAGVSTGLNSQSENSANEQLQNRLSPNIGLSLSIPIIDNKNTKSSIIISKSGLNKAKIALETAEQSVRFQIEMLVNDVKAADSRFSAAEKQFSAESENMKTINEMLRMGNITPIDFASQQNNYLSAQSELTQAKYSLMLANKLLEVYLGN